MRLIQNWLGIAAIIALCVLAVRTADAHHYETTAQLATDHANRLVGATFRIGAVRDGTVMAGTAFHIGGGYFVTAGHVVEGATLVAVMADDGRPIPGTEMYVVKSSYVAPGEPGDWAVLKARGNGGLEQFVSLEVDCAYEEHTGDIALTYGFPGEGPVEGVMAGLLAGFTPGTYYTTQATGPGASGSAVLGRHGKVVGILVAGPDMPGLHFLVWVQSISETPACGS